jgi:type III pantothenate kinase
MNLVIDSGNTRFKAATFYGAQLVKSYFFYNSIELKTFLNHQAFDCALVSSVSMDGNEIISWVKASRFFLLTHFLPVPIQIQYKTPETLGVDRIAAACGVLDVFPERDSLVIDAGTCVTFDFIDKERNYWGGSISPGIAMRFEALNTFTKRLPLVSKVDEAALIGNTTENSIRSGVLNGIVAEMEGIIEKYSRSYPEVGVVLCGGDALFFENKLKPTIFAAPDLVLSGLNRILLYNAAL